MDRIEMLTERGYYVAMKNALIQYGKFNLTPLEMKVVLYIISKIKPDDEPNTIYHFKIGNFIKVCGLNEDGGIYYKYVKDTLFEILKKPVVIKEPPYYDILTNWFSSAKMNRETNEIDISFAEEIKPFLFCLHEQYVKFRLENGVPLKNPYSHKLYIYLRSITFRNKIVEVKIDTLRKAMECESYPQFKDFKRYALQPAIEEIYEHTDLAVYYEVILTGRKATAIQFRVFWRDETDLPI